VYSPAVLFSGRTGALRGLAAVGLWLVSVSPALAQAAPPATSGPPLVFLSRMDAYFGWGAFITADPRFSWHGTIGTDVDLVRYPVGRLAVVADYEAVLGSEHRAFELNHGNYTLEGSASYRLGSVDVAWAFHHESRHLVDRPNAAIIAWNVSDFRATRRFAAGASVVEATLAVGPVLQRTFVDYTWTGQLRLAIRRPIGGHAAVFASGTGRLVGVDRARLGRDRQCGAALEAGLRLTRSGGALELVGGYERRIDGFPTDRFRVRAFTLGFRLATG
jgi:hypothetical protein